MVIEERIRPDLWKAIQAHYERDDYTEAVRDTLFHICEIIREKSGLSDKDGSTLIDHAFLGKTPLLLINKNETTTEKNTQQGVGLALKGIMQAIRDPLSHEKTVLAENDAEAIILFSNYLLNKVDGSQSFSKISDIEELLYDEDFTNTDEYAKCLIKEIPTKKRYDLLVRLFNNRENLPQHTLGNFINELMNCISKASYDDFIRIVSSSLIKCKDDKALRMYFMYFMLKTYDKIERLAQLRIEDLIQKSIYAAKMENVFNSKSKTTTRKVNCKGSLATWVTGDRFMILKSHERLIDLLFSKIDVGSDESDFVFNYFPLEEIKEDFNFKPREILIIKNQLLKGNKALYDDLVYIKDMLMPFEDNQIDSQFSEELKKCKEILDEIPF